MSLAEMLLPEFDMEMASTRKVLETIPDDKLDWKAAPTMQSIGWVASHLVEIPGWVPGTLAQSVWDLAPEGGEPYKSPVVGGHREALTIFDANVSAARSAIASASDEDFMKPFSLAMGGQTLFTMPKLGVVRTWVINHTIHHRAFLISYLRINGVAVPDMYG